MQSCLWQGKVDETRKTDLSGKSSSIASSAQSTCGVGGLSFGCLLTFQGVLQRDFEKILRRRLEQRQTDKSSILPGTRQSPELELLPPMQRTAQLAKGVVGTAFDLH